ncbi:MAG: hypothetical protein N2322_01270 [Terrimicrobiaceae bacterium]|nr:hypothetical protein [Terrimicrobiaceae bacterium]
MAASAPRAQRVPRAALAASARQPKAAGPERWARREAPAAWARREEASAAPAVWEASLRRGEPAASVARAEMVELVAPEELAAWVPRQAEPMEEGLTEQEEVVEAGRWARQEPVAGRTVRKCLMAAWAPGAVEG